MYYLQASSFIQVAHDTSDNLFTMAKKHKSSSRSSPKSVASSSPESEASSNLSALSRSPTPPESWSSPSLTSTEDDITYLLAPPTKRQKVTRVAPITSVRRSERYGSGRRSTPGGWMDPKSDNWDVLRVIASDFCLATDPLLRRPSPNHTYIDSKGRLKDPHKYSNDHNSKEKRPSHPKLQAHIDNGTATPGLYTYYAGMPHDRSLPIAGVIREPKFRAVFNDHVLTCTIYQEEAFHARPSIKLVIPDHLKAILVDDWENVTKNQQLVPLPSPHPVNSILADYLAFEKPKRIPGSAQADILEEIIAGLKEYFEKCLGRILLYR